MRKLFKTTKVARRSLLEGGIGLKSIRLYLVYSLLVGSGTNLMAQCLTVNSSNGYQVIIDIVPKVVVAPSTCQYGYNYNLTYDYDIFFSGNNIPGSLWTLQGVFTCNDGTESDAFFFNLPNGGGQGTLTTTSNPDRAQNDCAVATPELLGCNSLNLHIHGPGIPDQVLSCAELLPIELASFLVEPKGEIVELVWITSSELNNDFFTVERSPDGINWEEVSRMDGAGNSYQNLVYAMTDRLPLPGQSYYRLKQTDFDGQFTYSEIKSVYLEGPYSREMRIFPNPVAGLAIIDGIQGKPETLKIFDVSGRRVDKIIPVRSVDENRLEIDLSNLPAGLYTIATDRVTRRCLKI